MLVLTRKPLERVEVRIGDIVGYVTLVEMRNGSVALGFEFPRAVELTRVGPNVQAIDVIESKHEELV